MVLSSKEFLGIQIIECRFTLKRVYSIRITNSQKHRTDKYSQHSSIIWPIRLNGCVLVFELSLCGFEFLWYQYQLCWWNSILNPFFFENTSMKIVFSPCMISIGDWNYNKIIQNNSFTQLRIVNLCHKPVWCLNFSLLKVWTIDSQLKLNYMTLI